jgi:hypothetical protein
MPSPVHIICSESGSDDKITGLLSLFNLVEQIQVHLLPEKPEGSVMIQALPFRITATWMKLPEDEGQEFDFSIRIHLPANDTPLEIAQGEFTFERTFHRFNARILANLPFKVSGLMRVESRVRRSGAAEWLTQECPVPVEVHPAPTQSQDQSKTETE